MLMLRRTSRIGLWQSLSFGPIAPYMGRGLIMGLGLIMGVGCGDNDGNDRQPPGAPKGTTTSSGGTTSGLPTGQSGSTLSSTDGTSADTDASGSTGTGGTEGTSDSDQDSSTGTQPETCDDIICTGHGNCEIVEAKPLCLCDTGYILDETMTECIVDEHCIKLRFLEDHCRQKVAQEPAVSLFFGVDFCSGTAVTPEKMEQLALDSNVRFAVLENDADILDNAESYHAVIPKPVESYVSIVLDVSKSVIGDESDGTPPSIDLSALIGSVRTLVASLKPGVGDPRVAVAIYVFGRGVAPYVPFSEDFAKLDTKLSAIEKDHSFLPDSIGIYGSDLYKAVSIGLNSTQRIRDLRAAVSWDGILSTGTVVVVTDGNDQSGSSLSDLTKLIDKSLNQVISIGISDNVDDDILNAIGRDGSYLAPTPKDWSLAFEEVIQRVDEYPDRAYLLAYCSSKTTGVQEVTITLDVPLDQSFVITGATCRYDADEFSTNPNDVCVPDTISKECDAQSCGGLTACGGCTDDQCCTGFSCATPSNYVNCDEQNELCAPLGQICGIHDPAQPEIPPDKMLYRCVNPPKLGETCYTDCEPGVGYCSKLPDADGIEDPGICVATLPEGSSGYCEEGPRCSTQNCTKKNPDSDTDPLQCLPEAELYHFCGPKGSAVCEWGGYCKSSDCTPRKRSLERCSNSNECRSGVCAKVDTSNQCVWSDACYWNWAEKIRPDE